MVTYSSIELKVQCSSPTQYLIFFSFFVLFCFFVLLFSINIYLNNCYLIKCINKQQEKYHVSREKIVHHILNIWINIWISIICYNLCTVRNQSWWPFDHFLNMVQMSSFYRPIVIITFQHVNKTFHVSINKMCRIITIV